jgi:hypothetical protein
METIVEIAGLAARIVSGADDFLSAANLSQEVADREPVIEIAVEIAVEVRAGQGLEVKRGPCGMVEFSMSGVDCRLEPSEGKGRLAIVADRSVFEYALKVIYSTLLLSRGGGIFHAAGLVRKGEGYLFAGSHGAGKSTIAAAAPGGAEVLGDENIAVRKAGDGRYWMYSLPRWALGGAGGAISAGGGPKAPLAACFILSHGAGSGIAAEFDASGAADRARRLFENMIYLLPEKAILESAMKFADELQKAAPTAGLRYSLDEMEHIWDAIAGYLGKKI